MQILMRTFTADDQRAARDLSATVQWPHRLEDWDLMRGLGSGVVAESDGKLAGTAMCWRYGLSHAALGMVIVSPELRGHGVGRGLTKMLLSGLEQRSVVLNATEAGQTLYRSLGFAPAGTIRQHQGAAFQVELVPLPPGTRLRPLGRSDPAALRRLDREASGMPRDAVIDALLSRSRGVVLDRHGEAVGFALLRRFGHGCVIGPVVAPDVAGAKALIGHWLASRPGQFIRIDVPDSSGLSPWIEALGLPAVDAGTRMVRGTPPARSDRVSIFALISQALG